MEGFDAQAVAGQDQFFRLRVPEGDGEHAVEMGDEVLAVFLVKVDDDLGVGVGVETVAAGQKRGLEGREIEDLAVVDDPDRLVFIMDGLAPGGQVDDAQTAHPQGNRAVGVISVLVRAPVDDDVAHGPGQGPGVLGQSRRAVDSANTAHEEAILYRLGYNFTSP